MYASDNQPLAGPSPPTKTMKMLSHQFIQSSDPKSNQKYANLLVLYVKATFHVDDLLKFDSFFYCFLLMHS